MDRPQGADGRQGEVALRKLTFVLVLAACASPGIPPGGPVDKTAPVLLEVVPDSARTRVTPPAVIFHFDEVVSERPPAATSLDQLFLISPRDGAPSVDWKRKDVTVRPGKGWRANTTYVVTMLPGMADLRGNVRTAGARTVFSTGPSLAAHHVSGKAWNWLTGAAASGAYVEAIQLPDSIRYIALADSLGSFRVDYLPAGQFLVRAVLDENRNRGIDPRESWDSATVSLRDSVTVALYAIARDTAAPIMTSVSADDSVTLRLTFATPLEQLSLPAATDISVQAADSSRIPVAAVTLPAPDTTAGATASPRAPPPRILLVRLATPLRPGAEYRVAISRVTGLSKATAPAVRTFRMPEVKPPPAAPTIK
jgi:hypothetical protein